ncbi:MAG: class I SAM-dependent methyltransferase [Planctomycetota bacterium]
MARRDAQFFILSDGRPGDTLGDDAFYQSGHDFVRDLLGRLPEHPRRKALEIGCGLGRNVFALAGRYEQVIGLDISDAMVDGLNASDRRPANAEGRLTGPDARFPGIDDRSVDLVLSVICLQHIASWGVIERTIDEIGRVVSPNGVAAVQLDTRPIRLARELYMKLPDALLPAVHRRGMRRVSREIGLVRSAFEAAGLRIAEQRGEATSEHWFVLTARTSSEPSGGHDSAPRVRANTHR